MYLRVLLLVTVVVSGGWTLTPNEWEYKIIRSYVDWTTAIDSQNIPLLMSLHSKDLREMVPGRPALNYEEFQQRVETEMQANGWVDVRFEELLYSQDNTALARHVVYQKGEDGKSRTGKGVRLFRIEGDKVKIAVSIYNYDDI